MTNYYTCVTLLSILLLTLMLTIIGCDRNMNRQNREAFIGIYVLILLASFCEWLGVILNGFSGYVIVLHKLAKFIELSVTPIFPVIYGRSIFSVSENHNSKVNEIIIFLIGLNITLEFLSMQYELVFYVDDSGYYHHSYLYSFYILAFILSALYLFKKLFDFSKYYQHTNIIILLLLLLFIIIGVSIQFINPDLKVTWLSISIASVFVYIYYNEITMYTDHLTRLLNQRSYKSYLENISSPVTILLFDVDNFKYINDTFGHVCGDSILHAIGKAIKEVYGNYGYCYRIGGDEFCVILTQNRSVTALNRIFVNKIREMRDSNPRIPYVSIGYSNFIPGFQDVSDTVQEADKNLYYWKNKLKNDRKNLQK